MATIAELEAELAALKTKPAEPAKVEAKPAESAKVEAKPEPAKVEAKPADHPHNEDEAAFMHVAALIYHRFFEAK